MTPGGPKKGCFIEEKHGTVIAFIIVQGGGHFGLPEGL
jgi:hypothetical protein